MSCSFWTCRTTRINAGNKILPALSPKGKPNSGACFSTLHISVTSTLLGKLACCFSLPLEMWEWSGRGCVGRTADKCARIDVVHRLNLENIWEMCRRIPEHSLLGNVERDRANHPVSERLSRLPAHGHWGQVIVHECQFNHQVYWLILLTSHDLVLWRAVTIRMFFISDECTFFAFQLFCWCNSVFLHCLHCSILWQYFGKFSFRICKVRSAMMRNINGK